MMNDKSMRANETITSVPRPLRLLNIHQVIERTGLSKSTIYKLEGEGRFPMHVKLTEQRNAWAEHEIDDYISNLLEQRPKATSNS